MYTKLQQARTSPGYCMRERERREDSFVDNDEFYLILPLNSWKTL